MRNQCNDLIREMRALKKKKQNEMKATDLLKEFNKFQSKLRIVQ